MIELLFVLFAAALVFLALVRVRRKTAQISPKTNEKLQRLWKVAQESMTKKKYLPAEKALFTIIKIDDKNAAAYNRLGILYAKQKNYEDAIHCFEVASSIDTKPSSLHNLGLIYYETGKLEKAASAFEKSLDREPAAARYIAYAKVLQGLKRKDDVISALRSAVELESNPQTLTMLASALNEKGDIEGSKNVLAEVEKMKPSQSVKRRRR